jgi:hypothetical protein
MSLSEVGKSTGISAFELLSPQSTTHFMILGEFFGIRILISPLDFLVPMGTQILAFTGALNCH